MTPWSSPLAPAMQVQAAALAAVVPALRTDRLFLRVPRLADFDASAAIFRSDRAVHIGRPFTIEDAWDDFCRLSAGWLLRGHGIWAVETHPRASVGFVLIGFEPGDAEPELGWFLSDHAQGHGYATEAARAARAYGFATLGLARLVSYVAPANRASAHVAERLGAGIEGQLDGSDIWVHRPVAKGAVPARAETERRPKQDAMKTSKRGD
ncbi:MAG: GNAT family N-acetyltransferase [Pseudomonadota bacterium]